MNTLRFILAFAFLSVTIEPFVNAGDKPPEDAAAKGTECDTDAALYDHGALQFFHNQLCRLNVSFPGIAEEFLFKLVAKLGMNPDLTLLPADGTLVALDSKTLGDKTITGMVQKVVSPDTFAGTYETKATVMVNNVTEVTLYWTGSKSASKGFMIMSGSGFGTKKRLLYLTWDRTTEAQSVAVMGTRMASSYLSSPVTDDALYGKIVYNTTTKDTSLQMVHLTSQRGASPSSTVFACFKMYGIGTMGAAMRVGKTNDAHMTSGHLRTLATQDGIDEMDDWEGTDSKTYANGLGNGTGVQGFAMDYSCDDLNGASASGKPFNGDTVNHSMTKTQMDAMFTTN